ncbi:MAG: hypothetical protein MZV63_06515 [Marinilabiliales bacterium]|nr:hypothetical protein [Marinilabiliales bacterium]
MVRREMAMGADNGLMLVDPAFEGSDGRGIAAILKAAVQKGNYDLVLCGAQADDGAAAGGRHAGRHAGLALCLAREHDRGPGRQARRDRPRDRGRQPRRSARSMLPCVLSIQTGINEPRYVGIRGIRKVASVEIPVMNAAALGLAPADVGAQANRIVHEGFQRRRRGRPRRCSRARPPRSPGRSSTS